MTKYLTKKHAKEVATDMISRTVHSMSLEDQTVSIDKMIELHKAKLIGILRPIYLTEKQAAEYLNVNRMFLRRFRMKKNREDAIKGPPFVRLGKASIRYNIDQLEEWIKKDTK